MSEFRPLPSNMVITWGQGSKSYAEIMTHDRGRGNQDTVDWLEAKPPAQMEEATYLLLFHKALALAESSPGKVVHYIRQDMDTQPETENNRPFIMETSPRYFPGAEVKTIKYDGCIYNSDPSKIDTFITPCETMNPVSAKPLTHKQERHAKRRNK